MTEMNDKSLKLESELVKQTSSLDGVSLPDGKWVAIYSIIEAATGDRALAFAPVDGPGMCNEVTVVSTASGRFVVRTNQESHLSRYQREGWCLERAHEAGIPVPRVISCGVESGRAYSVAAYIEESSAIGEHHDQLAVWKALGSHAARLNQVPLVGEHGAQGAAQHFELSWGRTIRPELEMVFRDDYWTETGILTEAQSRKLQTDLYRCSEIDAPLGICQWDIGPDNSRIRNNNDKDIVLLDLEWVVVAPVPHYQLACVATPCGLSSKTMDAFVSGYGLSKAEFNDLLPDLKRLMVLRSMRSVRWAQDRKPEQTLALTNAARETIFELMGAELAE